MCLLFTWPVELCSVLKTSHAHSVIAKVSPFNSRAIYVYSAPVFANCCVTEDVVRKAEGVHDLF